MATWLSDGCGALALEAGALDGPALSGVSPLSEKSELAVLDEMTVERGRMSLKFLYRVSGCRV